MERLTTREQGLAIRCVYCAEENDCYSEIGCEAIDNIMKKLKHYEDLEEQVLKSTGTDLASMVGEFMHYYNLKKENRLLELPCKVGDTVYSVENGGIKEFVVSSFDVCMKNIYAYQSHIFIGEIGFSVFATKEEARKALVEMEKKDE